MNYPTTTRFNLFAAAIEGVWPVMLTPFNEDSSIDWDAVDQLTDWYLKHDVAGLFACCQSSEVFTLKEQEKIDLIERIVTRVAGRVPVIAGAMGQPDHQQRLTATRIYRDLGVAAVILSPNEFGASDAPESEVVAALQDFADSAAPVPMGLYECPFPYKRLLSPDAVKQLAASGRFVWMKDTSCDLDVISAKVKAAEGTPLEIYNANFDLMADAIRLSGSLGFSGIAANFIPDECVDICRLAFAEEKPAVLESRMSKLMDFNQSTVNVNYPQGAKQYLHGLGLPITPICRSVKGY